MQTFDRLESEVRGYVRSFPTVFTTAKANRMTGEDGRDYLDFFSGAGALNYGHNDEAMKKALLEYIDSEGVTHGLDMATAAKRRFLETFEEVILKPRQMRYNIQFPGPTGTNAVEAAIKLARKIKGRSNLIHFTHGFHGMTLGSMSVTSNAAVRSTAGVDMAHTDVAPFCNFYRDGRNTADDLERLLEDSFSGVDKPAAIILETVQGEGGIYVADFDWLRQIERICREHEILLIVDDIQAGVGRTGSFFSFEPAGITPDIVTVAKSLSGYGLPLAIVMMRPELDIWAPAEHTGTFRGNNHAFVTAVAALNEYWRDDRLEKAILRKGDYARERLKKMVEANDRFDAELRGRGLFIGLDCKPAAYGNQITQQCFERGLLMETTGEGDSVVKVMPPLITPDVDLETGLGIIEQAVAAVLKKNASRQSAN